ncbi:LLM class F420-dependent oxidoreductase [Alphaproteobacteria bacterium]|nr:LLM class F420-dependent oxidoreductase [Alphaproteobacteria bacterium]
MDWGIHLPHLGRQVDRKTLIHFTQTAEHLGCHSAWVSDHICWPAEFASKYPYTDDGSFAPSPDMGWLDAISTLTFVAACTETIRLGTTVLILPYRQPVQTAKQIASLDVLSEGRAILGVGVGWMAEEAGVLGMPWDKRGARSDEQLEIFRRLFSEREPSFDGEFYSFPKVGFEPKPIQTPLPIWVGGSSPAAFRRVAQYGHAFHAAFQPPDVIANEWAAVQRECETAGREPGEVSLSLRIFLDPAAVMDPNKSIAGSKDQMLEMIARLQAIGVTHLLLDPVARGGVQARLDALTRFMEDVAPHVAV